MKFNVIPQGSGSAVQVLLEPGETLQADRCAMFCKRSSVRLRSRLRGGVLQGLFLLALQGEDLWLSAFSSENALDEVFFVSPEPRELIVIPIDDETIWNIQHATFVCASGGVCLRSSYVGARKWFGQGLFVLQAEGSGVVVLAAHGSATLRELASADEYVADSGHVVAWPSTARCEALTAVRGWALALVSGDGVVCRFRGPGRLYLQRQQPEGLADPGGGGRHRCWRARVLAAGGLLVAVAATAAAIVAGALSILGRHGTWPT
eukprot:EG_transcript_19729